MKEANAEHKESPTGDVWQALDQHSQQLAHLLHTKADLSAIGKQFTA
jgi:hypothetical protein